MAAFEVDGLGGPPKDSHQMITGDRERFGGGLFRALVSWQILRAVDAAAAGAAAAE